MTARLIEGVRAAVWDGTELVVDEVSLRPPGPGEVTVRVLASGICHSDLNVMDGLSPMSAPVVLGHEAAGVVDRVGGIGVNAIAAARATGAGRIVAVDIDPRKEAAARHFGADGFVRDASTVADADVVIECSGASAAMSAVVSLAPTVALVGIPPAGLQLGVDARSLVLGRRLLGSLNGDIVPERDLPTILGQIRTGTLDVAAQVGGMWPLERIHDAIAAVRAGDVIRATLDLR
jgi:S-(hydroxymethyl)glutathione dehydrogenase / alcohol dehydrogenase